MSTYCDCALTYMFRKFLLSTANDTREVGLGQNTYEFILN